MASFACTPHPLLVVVLLSVFLSFAFGDYQYIGCFLEDSANPVFSQKAGGNGAMWAAKCSNACKSYRFFGIKTGNDCYCGNLNYARVGQTADSTCNQLCKDSTTETCGGASAYSVYRVTSCPEVCNNRSSNCTDSGVNKELTTCNGCANSFGSSCQSCSAGYYGPLATSCQACQCGSGAFNSSCDSTGQCYCKSGFTGASCSSCTSGKYLSGGACLDCGCGIGTVPQSTCNGASGQCSCKSGFTGRTCSVCEDGKYLNNGNCISCGCGVGSNSTICDKATGQCPCNPLFQGLTCSACQAGYTVSGSTCVDINECTTGSHNCSSLGACTNTIASFTCACNPGAYGDGYNCTACNCGPGATSASCDQEGICTCSPGFLSPTCSECLPERYGPNCSACPNCHHGTCNSLFSGNGQCSCDQGWASALCDACAPGYFGENCTGVCPSCGQGSCSDGLLGNGTCTCQQGWKSDGAASCSICEDGYYRSGNQCLTCHPSCGTCANGTSLGCLSCAGSLFLQGGSCLNICSPGQYSNLTNHCLPCSPSCLECSGPSSQECLMCPPSKVYQDGACLEQCLPGSFNSSGSCQACNFRCATCGGPSETACLSCPATLFFNPENGTCLDECPLGTFATPSKSCSPCLASCETCSNSSGCLSCRSGQVLYQGQCVNLCPDGYYNFSGSCYACFSTCATCSELGSNKCLSCYQDRDEKYLEGSKCVSRCNALRFAGENNICTACTCYGWASDCNSQDGTCYGCRNNTVGPNCEQCASGYWRNSTDPSAPCEKCECNQNSAQCNTLTGVCIGCTGFTTGDHCDACLPGYVPLTTSPGLTCTLAPTPTSTQIPSSTVAPSPTPTTPAPTPTTSTTTEPTPTTSEPTPTTTTPTSPTPTSTETPSTPPTSAPTSPSPSPTNPGTGNAKSSSSLSIGVGVGVSFVICGLVVAAIILVVRRKKTHKIHIIADIQAKPDLEMAYEAFRLSTSTTLPTLAEQGGQTLLNTELGQELSLPGYLKMNLEEDTRTEQSVAAGGGGSISLGVIVNPDLRNKFSSCADRIAIKKVFARDSLTDEENLQIFHQEVSVMNALSYHPNIARVLFYTEDPNAIVFPFYDSDLHNLIHNPANVYNPFHMREILVQITLGMQAVHSLGIAHRDLKPANFLLEANPKAAKENKFPYTVKITDFGVCSVSSSMVSAQKFINIFGISVKYAGPEVFSHLMLKRLDVDFVGMMRSDVYSFAISSWELVTRKHPWEGMKLEEIQSRVVAGERPPLPLGAEDPILAVMQDLIRLCWNQEPAHRPTFRDLSARLSKLL